MILKVLKYKIALLLFFIFGAKSHLQRNVENNHLITINTYLHNEISVFELIKIENERFIPKNVSIDFFWDRFQVNDIYKELCYFSRPQSIQKISEIELEKKDSYQICGMNLFQTVFSRDTINHEQVNTKMLEISKRLLRFFDYEYDLSRPSNVSNSEINHWRNNRYSNMKLKNLIVPGKGSSRLYVKTETDLEFFGNYFGYLKIKYEDKTQIKTLKLSISPPPLSISFLQENQEIESTGKKLVIDFKIRNHLIFRNLNIFVQLKFNDLYENLCQIRNKMSTESHIVEIKPGDFEKIQISCSIERLKPELIRSLLQIQINSFWSNSNRYKITYKYNEIVRYEKKLNRGIFLSNFELPSHSISEEYFNFYTFKNKDSVIKYLKENETGTLNFVNPIEENFLSTQYWINLDLLNISNKILNLRNIKIFIKIDSSSSEYLHVTFDNNNKVKFYEFDSFTQMNTLLFIKINLELNLDAYIERKIISNEEEKLKIPVDIILSEKNTLTHDETNILKRKWIFDIDLESEFDEYIIIDNILKNKLGQPRLIINSLDKNTTLSIMEIKNPKLNTSKEIEIRLLEIKDNNFTLISKVSAPRVKKFGISKSVLNFKELIDTRLFELKQANSAETNSIEDLPYFIEIGNVKRFQLATLVNCGIFSLNKNKVDFGIIPVSLFGSSKLIQKIELKLRRFGTKNTCSKKFSLGFRISSNFNIKVLSDNNNNFSNSNGVINIKREDKDSIKEYIYDFYVEDLKVFFVLIEPNFNNPLNVEYNKSVNISTQLEVYAPQTVWKDSKGEIEYIRQKSNFKNAFIKKNLFFSESIEIACIIRGLHISAGSPRIRSALHSEIMSQELVKSGKLPISLFFVEIKNEEAFPVQYSLQPYFRQNYSQVESIKEYFTKNYTYYISYENNEKDKLERLINKFEEQFNILEGKTFFEHIKERNEIFDNLAFNFPFNNSYLMNVAMVLRLGMVCIYNGEVFDQESSFCVKLIPLEIAEKVVNLKISMGHLRVNIWQIIIRICLDNKGIEFVTGLKVYESGRIDWYFYNFGSFFMGDSQHFEKFIPTFVSDLNSKTVFELKETVELARIQKIVRISTVPWIEVSNEIPRIGYLLPKENRLISILVHNQIITSSSINSMISELKCNYNLVFKGLTDIGETLDESDDPFSRMLLESDHELRQESIGMKSFFPLDWTIPNVVNDLGYGGGFVKKITLVNSPIPRLGENHSTMEYVQFIIEIQNPIICTKRESNIDSDDDDESEQLISDENEQEFEDQDHKSTHHSQDQFCTPFNNLEIVKGFRIIWYPYNNFSPTNYKSVEILIEDIPKYNFKTSSYTFESNKQNELEETLEVSQIFTDYIKEADSENSDFAYLLKISNKFVLNQQYTFKFAITHHENIKNSVFIPPFGFNITAQNHSLRWLRSLNHVGSDISQNLILKNFTRKICNGQVDILSDNSMILKWNKEFLKIIHTFSVSYFLVDTIDQLEEEWQLKEPVPDLFDREKNSPINGKNLLLISNSHSMEEGVSKFFNEDISNETKLFIKTAKLPSSLRIKIMVNMEDYNSEKFQCTSRAFQTNDGIPNEPEDFKFTPLSVNSVKLSWSIPESFRGSEIFDYSINLSPELFVSPSEYKIENINIISKKLMIITDKMFPLVTYKATIQARNKFGLGKPSTINHISPRIVHPCSNIGTYGLIINEDSRREISWKTENMGDTKFRSLLIYLYCNRRVLNKAQTFLIELLKASNVCKMDSEKISCNWIEDEEYIMDLKCENYSIKMVEKVDKYGTEDFTCIYEFGTQKLRKLKRESNNNIQFGHIVRVNHINSLNELNSIGEKKERLYYPRDYNPGWENGLMKTILKINLLSQNTSLIEIEVNYLHETENSDEIILNETIGNNWFKKYFYDIKQEKEVKSSRNMKNWSMFEERSQIDINSHKLGQTEQIELLVLNLIPEMTVLISIRELDKSNVEICASRHVLRIPSKTNRISLVNRRLLSSEILKVHLDDYFISNEELYKSQNKVGSNLRNLNVNGKVINRQLKLKMDTNTDLSRGSLPNSLFVSSKMIIDGWPEDFERRLFEQVNVLINSGHLRFKNNSKELSGLVENYKPISELNNYNEKKLQKDIASLFDGDLETGINFYNNYSSESISSEIEDVMNEENFPHISLSFNPPICILYAKLHWEGNNSPVSTMASVGLRSRNVSKSRIRNFNPIVHECIQDTVSGTKAHAHERTDTIQIIPPEEMVNTYLTNPSNRYPFIQNFTLSFAGTCNKVFQQTRDKILLSLREIEIVPCISNDLVLSYSDPLSENNISLVNSQQLLKKSQLEEKYSEIQRIILDNLKKEAKNNTENLALRDISIKYKKPVNETKIYLDIYTVLSEESKLRSTHIPSIRLLIQENNEELKPSMYSRNHRRLAENENMENISLLSDHLIFLWIDLTIIYFWNLLFIIKKIKLKEYN